MDITSKICGILLVIFSLISASAAEMSQATATREFRLCFPRSWVTADKCKVSCKDVQIAQYCNPDQSCRNMSKPGVSLEKGRDGVCLIITSCSYDSWFCEAQSYISDEEYKKNFTVSVCNQPTSTSPSPGTTSTSGTTSTLPSPRTTSTSGTTSTLPSPRTTSTSGTTSTLPSPGTTSTSGTTSTLPSPRTTSTSGTTSTLPSPRTTSTSGTTSTSPSPGTTSTSGTTSTLPSPRTTSTSGTTSTLPSPRTTSTSGTTSTLPSPRTTSTSGTTSTLPSPRTTSTSGTTSTLPSPRTTSTSGTTSTLPSPRTTSTSGTTSTLPSPGNNEPHSGSDEAVWGPIIGLIIIGLIICYKKVKCFRKAIRDFFCHLPCMNRAPEEEQDIELEKEKETFLDSPNHGAK